MFFGKTETSWINVCIQEHKMQSKNLKMKDMILIVSHFHHHISFHILPKAFIVNRGRYQASERERELERLVFLLLSHTSHTDLKSPVSECPLCEKVGVL